MKILALDTATEACSAALLIDGELRERFEVAPRGHAGLLLPFVDELLTAAGVEITTLDAIAISQGPGSFTGIRIGFAAAQGLATGARLGLVPVSTLQALAWVANRDGPGAQRILAILDARMSEVYVGGYAFPPRAPNGVCRFEERVCPPEQIALDDGPWRLVGPGAGVYEGVLRAGNGNRIGAIEPDVLPRASAAATIAAESLESGVRPREPQSVQPVYLRQRVAVRPR